MLRFYTYFGCAAIIAIKGAVVLQAASVPIADTRKMAESVSPAKSVSEIESAVRRRQLNIRQLVNERRYADVEVEVESMVAEIRGDEKRATRDSRSRQRLATYLLVLAAEARNEGDHEAARELLRRMEAQFDQAEAMIESTDRTGLLTLKQERVRIAREFGTFGDLRAQEKKLADLEPAKVKAEAAKE